MTRTFDRPGTYIAKLIVQRSAGCALDSTQTVINITSNKQILSPDTIVCQQGSFQIRTSQGQGPQTYQWSPATGLSSTSVAQPTVTTNTSRKYFLTTTNAAGCVFRDSINVLVNPPIVISNPNIDTVVCTGTTLTLRGNVTGTWRRRSGGAPVVLANNANQVTLAFTTTPGVDRLDTLELIAGCVGTRIIRTVFRPQITNPTAKLVNACTGTSQTLTANVLGTWIKRNGMGAPITLATNAALLNYIFSLIEVTDTIIFRACNQADTVRFPLRFQPRITQPGARDTTFCIDTTFLFRYITLPGGVTVRRTDTGGQAIIGNNQTANFTFSVLQGNNIFSVLYPNSNPFFCKDSIRVVGVVQQPLITRPSADIEVCAGDFVSFKSREVGYWFRRLGASVTALGSVVDTLIRVPFTNVGRDTIELRNCGGLSRRVVLVKPVPRITTPAARITQLCIGQTLNFTSTLTGDWTLLNSVNVSSALATGTAGLTNVLFNTLGTFRVLVNTNGCLDTVRVVVNPLPQPTLPTGNVRNLSCFNSNDGVISGSIGIGRAPFTAQLIGPNGYNQQQNILTRGGVFNFMNLVAGAYTLTMRDSLNCQTTQTITLTQPPLLRLDSVRVQSASCPTSLDGRVTVFVSGGTPPYNYNNITSNIIQNLAVGTYTLQVRDANLCTVNTQFTITSPPPLAINTTTVEENCTLRNGTATANVTGGTTPYSYAWNTNPPQNTQTALGLRTGSYTVNVTDAKGCTIQATANVGNIAGPRVSYTTTPASPVVLIFPDATIQFNATSTKPGVTYQWDFGDGTGATGDNPSHTYGRIGSYWVRLIGTDAAGCRDTARTADSIRIVEQPALIAPNVFTPNGDGVNELMVFQTNYLSEFQVSVFDRAGRIVFTSNSLANSWDGTTSGGPAPAGVYFYTVTLRYINGLKVTRTGNVTLLR